MQTIDTERLKSKWPELSENHRLTSTLRILERKHDRRDYRLEIRIGDWGPNYGPRVQFVGDGGGRGVQGYKKMREINFPDQNLPEPETVVDVLMPNKKNHRLRDFIRETYEQFLGLCIPGREEIHELVNYDS